MGVAERFWAKVDRSGGSDACWPWIANLNDKGYGLFWKDGRFQRAHRVAFELVIGPIPDGKPLDHLCRNRRCANPAHTEPVTLAENVMRGEGLGPQNARKSHCLHGHALPERRSCRGWRVCLPCKYARARASKERRNVA